MNSNSRQGAGKVSPLKAATKPRGDVVIMAALEASPALPPVLALVQHDVKRWGIRHTADARPRQLVRVADVVRAAIPEGAARPQGLPLKRAAAWVLDGLAELGALAWFALDPIDDPQPVTDATVWRRAYPARPKGWKFMSEAERREDRSFWQGAPDEWHHVTEAEAECRGLQIETGMHEQVFVDLNALRDDLPEAECDAETGRVWCKAGDALPALAELRGAAGAIEWLRTQWVDRIASADDLDKGDTAFLAVPSHDVARLPWLALEVASTSPAEGGIKKKRLPADDAFLAEYNALRAQYGDRVASHLADRYGVTQRHIQRKEKSLRVAAPSSARQDWASPIKGAQQRETRAKVGSSSTR